MKTWPVHLHKLVQIASWARLCRAIKKKQPPNLKASRRTVFTRKQKALPSPEVRKHTFLTSLPQGRCPRPRLLISSDPVCPVRPRNRLEREEWFSGDGEGQVEQVNHLWTGRYKRYWNYSGGATRARGAGGGSSSNTRRRLVNKTDPEPQLVLWREDSSGAEIKSPEHAFLLLNRYL